MVFLLSRQDITEEQAAGGNDLPDHFRLPAAVKFVSSEPETNTQIDLSIYSPNLLFAKNSCMMDRFPVSC